MKTKVAVSIAALCLSTFAVGAYAQSSNIEISNIVISIGNGRYYVHTIKKGETVYAIAKTYGVTESVVLSENPEIRSGLKVGMSIKIPIERDSSSTGKSSSIRKRDDAEVVNYAVKEKETLYSIARKFNIKVDDILALNKNITAQSTLSIGEELRIRIRRSDMDKVGSAEAETPKTTAHNSGKWYQYQVKQGDTLYALAHSHATTVDEILLANNLTASDLKLGITILLPNISEAEMNASPKPKTENPQPVEHITGSTHGTSKIDFAAFKQLHKTDTLHVALMLPIRVGNNSNVNYLEFYQGVLLGIADLKKQGYSVTLNAYNTAQSNEEVTAVVQDPSFATSDLIIGPVYESELAPVLRFAESASVPVVTPLANMASTRSGMLFQLAPKQEYKYQKIKTLIDQPNHSVVVIRGADNNDAEFEKEIQRELRGLKYETITFDPSSGASQFVDILRKDAMGTTTFVVLPNKEVQVEKVLTMLYDARQNIEAQGVTARSYNVIGTSRWTRFSTLDKRLYHANNVRFVSAYHVKRESESVINFNKRYYEAFSSYPTLYSHRGYDAMTIFAKAMFLGFNDVILSHDLAPLKTQYIFYDTNSGVKNFNTNWELVKYNEDLTITVE